MENMEPSEGGVGGKKYLIGYKRDYPGGRSRSDNFETHSVIMYEDQLRVLLGEDGRIDPIRIAGAIKTFGGRRAKGMTFYVLSVSELFSIL